MASTCKQQKRTKRAATKAKQNRVARSHMREPLRYAQPPELSAEDIVATAMAHGAYDDLFSTMKEAEAIDQRSMLNVFVQSPLLELAAYPGDMRFGTRYMMALLYTYRAWDGADLQAIDAWLDSPEFVADFAAAIEAKTMALESSQN
ncbi:hypothetical protein [Pseudomonas akapageensis]|uniref:hypothetical protein n=1 Tax=Pseudomonas akapageensis TaxID=2609961 RepID=UPI00140A71DD|nr:hypothetical protein [Pseudomonas akapageensis]